MSHKKNLLNFPLQLVVLPGYNPQKISPTATEKNIQEFRNFPLQATEMEMFLVHVRPADS